MCVCVCVCVCVLVCRHACAQVSIYRFMCLSDLCVCVFLSACLPGCLSVCLLTRLCVHDHPELKRLAEVLASDDVRGKFHKAPA